MYARTNTGSTHGDFQDRNGVNYVTSTESFGHCSQLFWKKDPNDSGVRKPDATTASQKTNSISDGLLEPYFVLLTPSPKCLYHTGLLIECLSNLALPEAAG